MVFVNTAAGSVMYEIMCSNNLLQPTTLDLEFFFSNPTIGKSELLHIVHTHAWGMQT